MITDSTCYEQFLVFFRYYFIYNFEASYNMGNRTFLYHRNVEKILLNLISGTTAGYLMEQYLMVKEIINENKNFSI